MKPKQIVENYGAVIEDVPIGWLQWYSGGKFPNPLEFKPFYPKWWTKMESQCYKCLHYCRLADVEVFDRFVNETKFNLEYYVSYNCPKCQNKSYARRLSIKVFEDQMREHVRKHSKDKNLIAAYETIQF
jgi:hypothetical protein